MTDTKNKQALVLHCGFPKCASTTLQYSFFPNTGLAYLGRRKNSNAHGEVVADLCNTLGTPLSGDDNVDVKKITGFLERVRHKAAEYENNHTIILSEEVLTCPNYFGFVNYANDWQKKNLINRTALQWVGLIKKTVDLWGFSTTCCIEKSS